MEKEKKGERRFFVFFGCFSLFCPPQIFSSSNPPLTSQRRAVVSSFNHILQEVPGR